MQILWLKSDYIDPPDTGGKIRTYNLIRELQNFCTVTYVSLKSTTNPPPHPVNKPWATNVVTFPRAEEDKTGLGFYAHIFCRMFSTQPYIVQKYNSKDIQLYQHQFESANGNGKTRGMPVVLLCDFLEMSGNVVWSTSWPKILFLHNVESVIWRRYYENEYNRLKKQYYRFEYQRLKRYEQKVCDKFDLILAVSQNDKDLLQQELHIKSPIDVIDTGVDVEYFSPMLNVIPDHGRLLFLGSLDWMPNIDGIHWFVTNIYPHVKARHPHVSLDIVGRRPVESVLSLAKIDRSIRVCGDVKDVRPYIAAAELFIVPLRIGSGTRLKIYEAMAMERAVVSTHIGAEGLPLQDDEHLALADSPAEFADRVTTLLQNPDKKNHLASQGYALATTHYSWTYIGEKLHDTCLQVCHKKE
jgi:polysaccharide biosynthesis protein PslH